ncbi:hypothetical protein [Bradyrhizobium oligotrophicum]|uniref:hypothetical protein n=1 Tax=Bradyrhizobium oligotrophicum TaxID=44255 RepID=UPI003EB7FDD1
MSERGVFAVDRGIWDHPAFADEPLTEREAWLWLIGEASFRRRQKRVVGTTINLERGQLCASVRFMADAWGWSKSRVDRFLKRLKTETMIGTEDETTGGTKPLVITICYYDRYQRVSLPDEPQDGTLGGTEDGTVAGQHRDKLEDIENTESNICSVAKRREPVKALRFEEFWAECPRRDGPNPKQQALKAYEQVVKSGKVDEQTLIDAAKRWCAYHRNRSEIGSKYIAHVRTWISQRRYSDYLAPPSGGGNPMPIIVPSNISPLLRGIVASPDEDWDKWINGYLRQPAHTRAWLGPGAPPGEPGCEVPAEIQRKHGFTPVPWVRRSDGKQFGAA